MKLDDLRELLLWRNQTDEISQLEETYLVQDVENLIQVSKVNISEI